MGAEPGQPSKPDRVISINDQMYAVPESVSAARAAALLPMKGSVDASHVLGTIEVPARPSTVSEGEVREYLPSESVEWVISACFAGAPSLKAREISAAFDKAWREKFGGFMGFGKDAKTGRWTFLVSSEGPTDVTDIKLAWTARRAKELPTEKLFEDRIAEVRKILAAFGECTLTASLSPAKAAVRVAELQTLKQRLGLSAVLKLVAPAGKVFDGKAVWDVMLSLGLKWGDMDCFHWQNRGGAGDDSFFSVETSTPPGYFLPESVSAGRMNPADLIFVYSIPRSAAPRAVFQAMARGVEYCRGRLGGAVVGRTGAPVDIGRMESDVAKIEQALAEAGFAAGSGDAMRFF